MKFTIESFRFYLKRFSSRWYLSILIIFIAAEVSFAQYHIETIKKLTSPSFHGRGYYKKGDIKAAKFIRKEFKKTGLSPVNGSYFQKFSFPVNTFPGKADVTIGGKKLVPGKDFIVSPACPSVKGTFNLIKISVPLPDFSSRDFSNDFLLIDKYGMDAASALILDSLLRFPPKVKGVVIVEPTKLTWAVSQKVSEIVLIRVLRDSFPFSSSTITVNIQNKFIPSYYTYNVMGYVPGTTNADSFIVFTAHYDHLGRMGKEALFAGANDNASGTAMIMDLAQHYVKPENRTGKSILFIAFGAEEAGLVGSKYFSEA